MTQEYIMSVAHTIRQQLYGLTPGNVICSWGVHYPLLASELHGMAALCLQVDARLFTGKVFICYDEGADYYTVYLKDEKGERLLSDSLDFTQLGDFIDTAIEKGNNQAEYDAFCENERRRLFRGEVG